MSNKINYKNKTSKMQAHENSIDKLIAAMPNTVQAYDYLDYVYKDRTTAQVKKKQILNHLESELLDKHGIDSRIMNIILKNIDAKSHEIKKKISARIEEQMDDDLDTILSMGDYE